MMAAGLMPVDDALALILAATPSMPPETLALANAAERILAAPITARRDQPPFPASAMDGYALRSADAAIGASLPVIGTSQAGARFAGALQPGTAIRIFTGAPVPDGADCVIMQEEVDEADGIATLRAAGRAGQFVRMQGNDFRAGDTLIAAGAVLTPARIALAASANAPRCTVSRRPRVGLLATGDELVPPGAVPGPDQIVASNSHGLAALIARWGGEPVDLGILPDDLAILTDAIGAALASGIDILVTTGGASVGAHDLVQDALVAAGVDLALWRIAMRPGKPMMFGTRGTQLVLGLPGNPVSAIATARVMLVPALVQMLGGGPGQSRMLPLAAPLPENGPRRHFVRAACVTLPDGAEAVLPSPHGDSGHLSSLAACNGFIDHIGHGPALPAGALVRYLPL